MPEVSIELFRKTDEGPLIEEGSIILATTHAPWRAILIEGGMSSGNPSVAVAITVGDEGQVVIHETSLLALQAMARGLVAMAEAQLGWEMPT